MGWYKFLNTIYQNNSEIVEEDIKTFKKLTQEINTIENYVELGCPFVGMFPLFSLIKQQNNNS